MTPSARRVRRVRLAAPRRELVSRGALLLEDALHTASLGSADGGRVLLVRRLDVGVIDPGRAPAAVALALEERFRHLAASAVWALDPSAPSADVVYFRDAVEAHAALAVRLASGGAAEGWFWRPAVSAWRPEMGRTEALRAVLAASAQTQAGAFGPVAVVAALVEAGCAAPLFSALGAADGPALLRACGWSLPSAPPRLLRAVEADRAMDDVPPAWRALLAAQLHAWGGDDARTVWLAAAALAWSRPARMLDVRLAARASRVVASLLAPPPPIPESGAPPVTIDRASVDEDAAPSASPSAAPDLPVPMEEVDRGMEAAASAAPDPPMRAPRADAAEEEVRAADQDAAESRPPLTAPAVPTEVEQGRRTEAAPSASPVAEGGTGDAAESALTTLTTRTRARFSDVPQPTVGGGVAFVVPVLSRLGIGEAMADAPWLADAAFTGRLLRAVALRCGVPAEDPILAAFGADEMPRPVRAEAWMAPAVWMRGIAAEGPATLRRTPEGASALFDASGRLPLAWWRGEMPDAAAALAPIVVKVDRMEARGGFDLLLEGWTTAARRWSRRAARTGLWTLVHRPARVLATRTHVDLVFDHHDADVRVRRAGLDIDPGWVPWLGRVVQFHYLHGERPRAAG